MRQPLHFITDPVSRWADGPMGRIERWSWYAAITFWVVGSLVVVGVSLSERL